ncbi:hypothetical protein [Sphaerisporangium dianthi]|uniref:Transposase n=1 Tax=Sphaerisporangium dianthi TaxID=1436120 RepID=A0ABV9CFX9_9ACTN
MYAELTLGRGIAVGHGAVAVLMHRAGIKGLSGHRRRRPTPQVPTATDMVDRLFTRSSPNQPWVTDITEHPTREGKRRHTWASTPATIGSVRSLLAGHNLQEGATGMDGIFPRPENP